MHPAAPTFWVQTNQPFHTIRYFETKNAARIYAQALFMHHGHRLVYYGCGNQLLGTLTHKQ